MTKYKYLIILTLLLSLASLSACAQKTKLTEFPDCKGQACTRVAQEIDWPEPVKKGVFTVAVENYVFKLPSMPVKAIKHWGEDVSFVCEDGSILTFNLETRYSLTPELNIPKTSKYSVADSAEMTFTKTINDPPPSAPNDLWIWQQALFLKTVAFQNGNPIFTATKGPLTLYVWEKKSTFTGDSMTAYIFDANSRKSYARIYGKYMSFEKFKSIMAAVELK